jgi:hypothetical protein
MGHPWDRTTLYAEIDRQYRDAFPWAPQRIDPGNPEHREWQDTWNRIEEQVLNAATDFWFFIEYPQAPERLDPDDFAHRGYVAEWIRLRDRILGDGVVLSEEGLERAEHVDDDQTADSVIGLGPHEAGDETTLFPDEFRAAAAVIREDFHDMQSGDDHEPDPATADFVYEQLEVAQAAYLGNHFDHHDHWVSTRRTFDTGIGFNDLGVEVRVVGPDRHPRIGLVGSMRSTGGGWTTLDGAPTH